MTATEILQQAKDEVARKYCRVSGSQYKSWLIMEKHLIVTHSQDLVVKRLEEASLLAMERIAEMSNAEWRDQRARLIGQNEDLTVQIDKAWDAAEKYGREMHNYENGWCDELPKIDKSTYMNNLFPKI